MPQNLPINYLKAPHSVDIKCFSSPFSYNPPSLQLEKCKDITCILQWQIQLHIAGWSLEIPALSLLFKRPHHETLNTQKTTGTGNILTLTWQMMLHTDVEFNALCSFKDAFQYLSWWAAGIMWKSVGISGFPTLCCHHRALHQWEIHCTIDSQGELCPQMPRRDLHSDVAGRRTGGVVVATEASTKQFYFYSSPSTSYVDLFTAGNAANCGISKE